MVEMLMFLACISLGSAGQTYDVEDPIPKQTDPVSPDSTGLWASVVVEKGSNKWEAPAINLKSDCLWFDTELLCKIKGGEDCQWMTDKCENKEPFTHVEDFCYATPKGEELNQQQCDWLPYWKREAAKPSSKAVGDCKLVGGEKIECKEEDTCAAGVHGLVKKEFSFTTLTFNCQDDCSIVEDLGIREELTHRCCAECNTIRLKKLRDSKQLVECAGCADYIDKPLETEHTVTCEWSTEKKDHEICKHHGFCKTGTAKSATKQASAQCGVVPCNPECIHDRQMHASCCEVCLQKMCEKDGDGHFLNYGKLKDNQMCRGCAPEGLPPSAIVETTTPTPAECTPFCCAKAGIHEPDEPDEPHPLNYWLIAVLPGAAGFLLGLCLTGYFFFLWKGDSYSPMGPSRS